MTMYRDGQRPPTRPLPALPESRITAPRNADRRGDSSVERRITTAPTTTEDRVVLNVNAGPNDVFMQATIGTDVQLLIYGDGRVDFQGTLGGPLQHTGSTAGFYGTTPISKPTGVAVSAAGIHAALVSLGLIAA